MDENCNGMYLGPTTVKVRVTGLTPGPHGFHLVSGFSSLPSIIHGFVCSKFSELFFTFNSFLVQHEFGDTTNGCISTGRS